MNKILIDNRLYYQILDNKINKIDLTKIIKLLDFLPYQIIDKNLKNIKSLFKINKSIQKILINGIDAILCLKYTMGLIRLLLSVSKSINTIKFDDLSYLMSYDEHYNLNDFNKTINIKDLFDKYLNLKTIKFILEYIDYSDYKIKLFNNELNILKQENPLLNFEYIHIKKSNYHNYKITDYICLTITRKC